MMNLEKAEALAYNGAVLLLEKYTEEYESVEKAMEVLLEELNTTPEEMFELGIEEFENYTIGE